MRYLIKKITAFTLAELMLVLGIMGIIATLGLRVVASKEKSILKYSYYSAFATLKNAASILFKEGCTDADVSSNYCASKTSLPKVTCGTVTLNPRCLCARLTDKINVLGDPDCLNPATTTTFTDDNLNFRTPSSARYFNFNTAITTYEIYVDINGPAGRGIIGTDILPFFINTADGTVSPYYKTGAGEAAASMGATSKTYLAAGVKYTDAGTTTWLDLDVDYRTAVCHATGLYNGASGNCTGKSKLSACNTYTCEVVVINPYPRF